jgi:Kef-type K+ transport system membrane component KefB
MTSLGSFIFISMEFLNKPFYEFGALLIVASILGALGRLFKQPLIVTFIAVGILVGSAGLNIIDS